MDDLLKWVSSGRTILSWCELNGISVDTVFRRERQDMVFRQRVRQAIKDGCRALAERTLEMVNEEPPTNLFGAVDSGYVAWRKLQVGHTMSLLKVWDREQFGDKLAIGGDANAPPVQFSDVERAAKLNSILAAAKKRIGFEDEASS